MTISLTLPPHHRYTTPPPKNLHHTFLLHSQVMCPPITLIVHHHPSNHPSSFTHTIVTIPHKPQAHYHIHLSTPHFILPFTSHHTFHSHLTTLLSPLRLGVQPTFEHTFRVTHCLLQHSFAVTHCPLPYSPFHPTFHTSIHISPHCFPHSD